MLVQVCMDRQLVDCFYIERIILTIDTRYNGIHTSHRSSYSKDSRYLLLSLVKSSLHIESEIDLQHRNFLFDLDLNKSILHLQKNPRATNSMTYWEMLHFDNRMDRSIFGSKNIVHDTLNKKRKCGLTLNDILAWNWWITYQQKVEDNQDYLSNCYNQM
jgi:hypothetical protein